MNDFGFGLHTDEDKNCHSFDENCVDILAKIAKPKSIHIGKWSREFRMLRKEHGEQLVSEVLSWLCSNHHKDATPKIRSATALRKQFKYLLMVMNSSKLKLEETPVNELIKAMAKRMDLSWPGQEKRLELQFLQHSYNNMYEWDRKMVATLYKLRDKAESKDKVLGGHSTAHWRDYNLLRKCHFSVAGPLEITKWWALEVNETAWKWNRWNGDLLAWVLTPDNKRLDMLYSSAAAEFRWNGGLDWAELKKQVKEMKVEHVS